MKVLLDISFLFLYSIICFVLGLKALFESDTTPETYSGRLSICISVISVTFAIITLCYDTGVIGQKNMPPKAIDVYRGKTELQITSVNNVPKDTIVIWKQDIIN